MVRPSCKERATPAAAKPAYSPDSGIQTGMSDHGCTCCFSKKSAGTHSGRGGAMGFDNALAAVPPAAIRSPHVNMPGGEVELNVPTVWHSTSCRAEDAKSRGSKNLKRLLWLCS